MLADKSGAGAFPRDKVDVRIVKEVKSGLCTYTGAGDTNSGAIPGIINSPDEAEGLDGLTYKTSGTIRIRIRMAWMMPGRKRLVWTLLIRKTVTGQQRLVIQLWKYILIVW